MLIGCWERGKEGVMEGREGGLGEGWRGWGGGGKDGRGDVRGRCEERRVGRWWEKGGVVGGIVGGGCWKLAGCFLFLRRIWQVGWPGEGCRDWML